MCTRTHFLVVFIMSAKVIVDTAFIDRLVKAILPETGRVVLQNAPSVALMSVNLLEERPKPSVKYKIIV